ncbi:MAG: type IV secretion system protein [Oscillospiraceae bacterium]
MKFKKILVCFCCVFFACFLLNSVNLSVNAAEETITENDNGGFDLESLFEGSENKIDWSESPFKQALDSNIETANNSWGLVGNAITASDTYLGLDPMTIGTKFEGIFKTFAYTICLLFFGINMIEKSLQFEIMTFKGACSIFGRVIFAKIWIDLSYKICGWIMAINNNLVSQLIGDTNEQIAMKTLEVTGMESSDNIIVGWIIDFFKQISSILPILLVCLIMAIAAAFITFKLTMRVIELSLTTIISPVFFAFLVGDTTKKYFINFITTFIGIVTQTLFMAVVFGLASTWWQSVMTGMGTDYLTWFAYLLPNMVVLVAFAYMMCKPPKVLTNLVHA